MQTPAPPSPPFLERFLEVLFCQSKKQSRQFGLDLLNADAQWNQTGVLSASISF
jgi:hypothetical protein